MSQSVRQSNLFSAEDYTQIYKSFKNVDFKAYDYDTIKQALIDYIRKNYPENFNDYVESSEYIATIELLAFVASSIAFRVDLNSRENFLDTAERRESVIRLANMINYQPKRNLAASGVFKILGVQTTEPLQDSMGNDLQQSAVFWNDPNNVNSYGQFITIMNSILSSTNQFGSPYKQKSVGGIPTSVYQLNNLKGVQVVYPISVSVNGQQLPFELVNVDIDDNGSLIEKNPDPANAFQILYMNDGQGLDSNNTGFFFYFRQGTMSSYDARFDFPIQNRVVEIPKQNVNETDVFVQEINQDGSVIAHWEKVPNVNGGSNVVYNSISIGKRKVYAVTSGLNDSISIVYPDGNFGDVPTGIFRTWYRTSANTTFAMRPAEASSLNTQIEYVSDKDGQKYTATFIYSLMETVGNSSPSETNEQVKVRAPQVYYTQDRMVNNKDYNVFPLTVGNQIAKVKTINRTNAGHSRYIDINDPTGFHNNLLINSNDGAIYKDSVSPSSSIRLDQVLNEENKIASVTVEDFLTNDYLLNFFYNDYLAEYKKYKQDNFDTSKGFYNRFNVFELTEDSTNLPTDFNGIYKFSPYPLMSYGNQGYFVNTSSSIINPDDAIYDKELPKRKYNVTDTSLGENEFGKFKLLEVGSKIIFSDPSNSLNTHNATVMSILATDKGSFITFDVEVPNGWVIKYIYPRFKTEFSSVELEPIIQQLKLRNTFSLKYDVETSGGSWSVMVENPDRDSSFDYSIPSRKWLVYAYYDSILRTYNFISRGIKIIFESYKNVRFYFDANENNYDQITQKALKDTITVTTENKEPEEFEVWKYKSFFWVKADDETISYPRTTISFIPLRGRDIGMEDIVVEELTGSKFLFSVDSGVLYIKGNPPADGDQISITYLNKNSNLMKPIVWNLSKTVIQDDGYLDTTKIEVMSADTDLDGIPDNIFSFNDLVSQNDIVFTENTQTPDGNIIERLWNSKWLDFRKTLLSSIAITYKDLVNEELILCVDQQNSTIKDIITNVVIQEIINGSQTVDTLTELSKISDLVIFTERRHLNSNNIVYENTPALPIMETISVDLNIAKTILTKIDIDNSLTVNDFLSMNLNPITFSLDTNHFVKNGRAATQNLNDANFIGFHFMWEHYAPSDNRIDPSISNIMDMYLLTNSYYGEVKQWKTNLLPITSFPKQPSTESLRVQFGPYFDGTKMMSDQIIYQPASFKLLFGARAEKEVQALFYVVKLPTSTLTDNEIKSNVIKAVDKFFDINNWDFGEAFYFTELAAFIHQQLSNAIGSVLIVPKNSSGEFGDLFQIQAQPTELFLSTATVNDVNIVTSISQVTKR